MQAAQAHADLISSDPVAGSVLAKPPTMVRLSFSEGIAPQVSSAVLVDATGAPIAGPKSEVDPSDPRTLTMELPPLSAGGYGVLWHVLAQDDGHTTTGVVVFSVGSAKAPALAALGTAGDSSSGVDVVLRWMSLCLLAGAVGGVAVARIVLQPAARDPALRTRARRAHGRVLRFSSWCASGAAVLGVAVLLGEAVKAASLTQETWWTRGIGNVLAARWGHLWVAREIAVIGLAVVLSVMASALRRHDGPPRWFLAAAATFVVAIVWVQALGSHAAVLSAGRTQAVVADAVHLLTVCLWLGALPALVLIIWTDREGDTRGTSLVRVCAVRFSVLAASSVFLVAVTGLYSAGLEVATLQRIAGTSYGRALLVKSALLVLAVGLGAANASRLHGWFSRRAGAQLPATAHTASRRLLMIEIGVGAGLLLAAGLLTSMPTARGPTVAHAPDASWTGGGSLNDLVVSVSISPNRPGVNGFTVLAQSSRRPAPAPIAAGGAEPGPGQAGNFVLLHEGGAGKYFGTATAHTVGRLRLAELVQRGGPTQRGSLGWTVAPSAPVRLIQPKG